MSLLEIYMWAMIESKLVREIVYKHYKKFNILRHLTCDPWLKTSPKYTTSTVVATVLPNRCKFCSDFPFTLTN